MRQGQHRWVRSAGVALAIVSLVAGYATPVAAKDNQRRALVEKPAPQAAPAAEQPPSTPPAKEGEYSSLSFEVQGGCNFSMDSNIREFPDEEGGVSVEIGFSGTIDCTSDVEYEGEAYLVDRTPGFDGQILAVSDTVFGTGRATTASRVFIPANYAAADDVEVAFAADLFSANIWTECNDRPGARILFCQGLGTNHLTIGVGGGKFKSKKRKPCTRRPHHWNDRVHDKYNGNLALPEFSVEWCSDSNNSVVSARMTGGPNPRSVVSALTAPTPVPNLQAFQISPGVTAYRLTFTFTYTFATKWSGEVGFGGKGGRAAYEAGESCQVSVDITYSGPVVADRTVNPCRPWLPGGRSMINTAEPTYFPSQNTIYVVSGAPANSQIRWSSSLNGTPVEDRAFYGQVTDGGGNWTGAGATWTPQDTGQWVKTVHIGSFFDRVAFEVAPDARARIERITSPNVPNGQPYSADRLQPNTTVAIFGTRFRPGQDQVLITQGANQFTLQAGSPGWFYDSATQINILLPGGLTPGQAQVRVRHDQGTSEPFTINVVNIAPRINLNGVVNPNAGYTPTGFKSGVLTTIFGDFFTYTPGDKVRVTQGANQWTITHGSTNYYDSGGQINFTLPPGLVPGQAQVQVINSNNHASDPATITIVP